jgi:hypothetical protein
MSIEKVMSDLGSHLSPFLWGRLCLMWKGDVWAGTLLLAVHQLLLSCSLIDFVSAADRSASWWAMNKEGIFSLPGYYALFLGGGGITHLIRSSTEGVTERDRNTNPTGALRYARLCVFALGPVTPQCFAK